MPRRKGDLGLFALSWQEIEIRFKICKVEYTLVKILERYSLYRIDQFPPLKKFRKSLTLRDNTLRNPYWGSLSGATRDSGV